MIIQACLNGARQQDFHPAVLVLANHIVSDAVSSVAAGASELHIHIRDDAGAETLNAAHADPLIASLRQALPGTLIGVSTGAWIEANDDFRLEALRSWRILPDYASVNLSEHGAPGVIALLHQRGIGIEAGLGSVTDAARLLSLDLLSHCFRVLIELDDPGAKDPFSEADRIIKLISQAAVRKPVLLHGAGRTVWPFVKHAFHLGYSTRVGLEDGAELPDGSLAASNVMLVQTASALRTRS